MKKTKETVHGLNSEEFHRPHLCTRDQKTKMKKILELFLLMPDSTLVIFFRVLVIFTAYVTEDVVQQGMLSVIGAWREEEQEEYEEIEKILAQRSHFAHFGPALDAINTCNVSIKGLTATLEELKKEGGENYRLC